MGGLTRAEAEDLFGWLARQGCSHLAASAEGAAFGVRCLCPPGLRLAFDGHPRLLPVEAARISAPVRG